MWAFYGYSKIYPLVLGFFEIAGAILLLFRKTRLLGGLVITSILFNVILQDVFYGVNEGALRAAILYQVSVFIIFWLNRKLLTQIMQFYFKQFVFIPKSQNKWLILVLAGIGAVFLKVVEAFLTHWKRLLSHAFSERTLRHHALRDLMKPKASYFYRNHEIDLNKI